MAKCVFGMNPSLDGNIDHMALRHISGPQGTARRTP